MPFYTLVYNEHNVKLCISGILQKRCPLLWDYWCFCIHPDILWTLCDSVQHNCRCTPSGRNGSTMSSCTRACRWRSTPRDISYTDLAARCQLWDFHEHATTQHIWTNKSNHRRMFIIPGLSSTLNFNFQEFPGPNPLSGTFDVLEIWEIKIQDFAGGVGTLILAYYIKLHHTICTQ